MKTNNPQGWIKLHRSILDWEWYDEPNTFRLFLHLLLKANHKPRSYRGVLIQEGQVMTGFSKLSDQTKISLQSVRTCLKRLELTNEITIKSTTQGTIIQLVNYSKYQVSTSEVTNEQQTTNKRLTTNKNDNNENNALDTQKFLEWFNKRRTQYLEIPSNSNRLTRPTEMHLESLKKAHTNEDFEKAMINLCNDQWANESSQVIPNHLLKPDNFTKYLNKEQKPIITKRQKISRGWKLC